MCTSGRKNWCAGMCAANYQNVCNLRADAAENLRTLKVCSLSILKNHDPKKQP